MPVEHRKALAAITTVRRLAAELSGEEIGAYTIGLLIGAVAGFSNFDFERKLSRSETRHWLHRLFCTGLVCQCLLDLTLSGTGSESSPDQRRHLHLDPNSREVWIAGQKVGLSPTEFELLTYLHDHPGILCKRADIAREVLHVAGDMSDDDEQLINTTMGRLRKKIEFDPNGPRYIETLRGLGYKLLPPDIP